MGDLSSIRDKYDYKSPFYIRLENGKDGFAEISEISLEPLAGKNVLKS